MASRRIQRGRAKVIIDGRRAQQQRTGVGHYTLRLLQEWPGSDALVLGKAGTGHDSLVTNHETRYLSGKLSWHLKAAALSIFYGAAYYSPESLLVPILLGKRATLTIHDLTPISMPQVHSRRNVFVHRLGFKLAIRRVGSIVVPTSAVAKDLYTFAHVSQNKTTVAWEGVRRLTSRSRVGSSTQVQFVYVGTIEPRKNVNTLVEAFLQANIDNSKITIAGKVGWLSESETETFMSLIKHPSVDYLGYIDDDEVPRLMANATAFCYISQGEGFGLPIAEAMALGVPVIYSDDPALVEVAQGTGIVVRRSNLIEDAVGAMRSIANRTEEEAERDRVEALTASREFSWIEMASKIESVTAQWLAAPRT